MRGLPSWVAAVTLVVATTCTPWFQGVEGAYFSRGGAAPANAGLFAMWFEPPDFPLVGGWWFVAIAVVFVVARVPRWVVIAAAVGGAALCVVELRSFAGGPVVAFAALALGVAGAFWSPRPQPPWVVPVLAGGSVVVLIALPRIVSWIPGVEWWDFGGFWLVDLWAPAIVLVAGVAVALTPVVPGGRWRALAPVIGLVASVVAVDNALWRGWMVVVPALAAAALVLAFALTERRRVGLVVGVALLAGALVAPWTQPEGGAGFIVVFGALDQFQGFGDLGGTGWQHLLGQARNADGTTVAAWHGPVLAALGTLVCLVALAGLARRRSARTTL